jgi:hypothetical protein
VAAVAAGGWIAVLIILIVCLIGLLVGSVFGIFFSGEPSGDGGKMINGVIGEIDVEYQAQIDAIIGSNAHDLLDMSGARAAWKEVLAVYTVRTVSDPDNPMEVATVDDDKAAILRSVFWEMNAITHSVETVDVQGRRTRRRGQPRRRNHNRHENRPADNRHSQDCRRNGGAVRLNPRAGHTA